jgi:hypothetical protein
MMTDARESIAGMLLLAVRHWWLGEHVHGTEQTSQKQHRSRSITALGAHSPAMSMQALVDIWHSLVVTVAAYERV